MSNGLCPNCEYQEIGSGRGNIIGYAKVSECEACQLKRVEDAATALLHKKEEEKNELIAQKMRETAIADLRAEGKLDEDGNVVKDFGK